ncbi:MAG: ornithine carbamoyltransferase [Bacteroidia bacterium]|nr:ornithine carbamoyltransferase [Bacteroidia bacterium]
MAIQFTRNGRKAMLWAQVEAMRRGDLYVEPEHLLLGLLHGENTGALRLLDRLALSGTQIKDAVAAKMPPEAAGARVETSQLSPGAKKIVEQARRETETTGDDYVGTEHLMLAVLRGLESGTVSRLELAPVLSRFSLTHERAAEAAKNLIPESPMNVEEEPPPLPVPSITPRPGFLRGRDLLSIADLTPAEVRALFELTREIKSGRVFHETARGKTLALLFEKPSLRTRVTFGVAMTRLGGEHMYLGQQEIGLGSRESVADVAKCLSRWVDGIAMRTFEDSRLREFAEAADIPVINALTDREHPCQALADFYTILESRSSTSGMKMVFVGDGNNVAHSLMLLAPCLGTHFTLCCPEGYEPDAAILEQACEQARTYNTNFEIVHDPISASDDADVLYTDVWTSMGQEAESERRLKAFEGFQVGPELIREAKDDVLVLHCLPAHRGEEIAADIIDGPHSGVFDQAENRLHTQQALLAALL